jgi:hypothetical protein
MNDELQKIKGAQQRRFELLQDLTKQKEELDRQNKQQQRAILEGRDSLEYETAIIRIETKIAGIKAVIKALDQDLKGLDEEQARKDREERLQKIEQTKSECLDIASEIYALIGEIITKTNGLKEKYDEHRALARGVKQEGNFQNRISHLMYSLKKGVSDLLPSFLREIFADGKLVKPDDLRRTFKM